MDCRLVIGSLALVAAGFLVSPAVAAEPEVLMWDQMMPSEDLESPPWMPGVEEDPMSNPDEEPMTSWVYGTRPVKELDGKFVKLPGFVVPLESDEGGLLDEFLLVPYFGACIHVPPPPPNQIVYVKLDKPAEITNIWDPYWIIGTIQTKPYMGDIAETVYQMAAERLEKYEY